MLECSDAFAIQGTSSDVWRICDGMLGVGVGEMVGVRGLGESRSPGVSALMEKLSIQLDWGKSGGNTIELSDRGSCPAGKTGCPKGLTHSHEGFSEDEVMLSQGMCQTRPTRCCDFWGREGLRFPTNLPGP